MTRKQKRQTIYGLYDPSDKAREIRYIGYTAFTPEQRLKDHIGGAQKRNDTHKQKWIRKLLRGGLTPVIIVLELFNSKDWKHKERHWIAEHRAKGHRLTNSTDGGEGLINPSKDVRKRIGKKVSVSLIGNQRRKGVPHKPGFGAEQSKRLKASKKFRAAHRRRRGKPGPKHSAATCALIARLKTGVSRPDIIPMARAQAEKNKGSYWANDGVANQLVRPGKRVPKGFVRGRLVSWNDREWTEESRRKSALAKLGKPGPKMSAAGLRSISESKKNSRWITNGLTCKTIQVGQEPPPGWRFGRKLNQKENNNG